MQAQVDGDSARGAAVEAAVAASRSGSAETPAAHEARDLPAGEGAMSAESGFGVVDHVVGFAQERPLTMAVGLWASLMVGTGLYVYKRKSMSFSQKLIHSRLVAQAGVLTGICSVAIVNVLHGNDPSGVRKYDDAVALYDKFDRPEFAALKVKPAPVDSAATDAALLHASSAAGASGLIHRTATGVRK